MTIDETLFRLLMSHFASGVTVITTIHENQPYGITVSSFTSLSLNPPLVLICINQQSSMHDIILRSGAFAINILANNQEHLSIRFSTRNKDKFSGVDWCKGHLGLPLLEDVLTTAECRLLNTLYSGDHTIFIGEVLHGASNSGMPLLYYKRNYYSLQQGNRSEAI